MSYSLFRTFPYRFQHNTHFGNQHNGEQYEEDEERGLNRTHIQFGDSRTGGQHILNGPRLTTALGNHPACLSGKISQRNGEHCHPMHPAHPRQIFLIGKNKNCNEEKDEVSAQYHHYAKHIERKRHIGNQLVDILYITIAEIGHILLQHLSCHLRLGIVASGLCLTIVGESADSRFPFLDLLPGRKRGCAVFQRITAFQQVIDARHKSL